MIQMKRLTGFIFILLSITTPQYVFAQLSIKKMPQITEEKFSKTALETISNWQALLRNSTDLNTEEKLQRINSFFNLRVRFEPDSQTWNQSDYWATPLETLAKARGDCEDFTIAKYFSLILLGIPEDQLQLTYVNATRRLPEKTISQTHMVLTYFPDNADPVVLDNLINDIRPRSERSDLKTIFSFNEESFWIAGENRMSSPQTRIRRWGDVRKRMQTEGLL